MTASLPAKHDAFERARWASLAAILLLGALLYSFRLSSFLHAKEAVLQGGLVVSALLAAMRGRTAGQGFRAFLPLWLGLFVAVGSGMCFARVPARVIEEAARFGALLLLVSLNSDLLASRKGQRCLYDLLALSGAAVAALGLLQYFGSLPVLFPVFPGYEQRVYSVFGNQDLFGGYLAITLPLALGGILRRGEFKPARYVAAGLIAIGLVLSGSRSAWLAAALAVSLAWFQANVLPGSRKRAGGLVCAALLLVVAATWPQPLSRLARTFGPEDPGGHARLWFWDGSLRMAAAHPVLGVGLGNYPYWSPWYMAEALHGRFGTRHYANELHTEHAHSEPLEFFAETGLPGLLCAAWLLNRLRRKRGAAWPPLLALLIFCFFNAGLHSTPHALAGVLLAGALLALGDVWPPQRTGAVRVWGGVAAGFAICAVWIWAVLIPSVLLTAAQDAHTDALLQGRALDRAGVLDQYQRALAHGWWDPILPEEYGVALEQAGRTQEAYRMFQQALRALDTGSLYGRLGEAALTLGDDAAARRWFEAQLFRWPRNQAAWARLWGLAPAEQRAALAAYARRWRLALPPETN